MMEFFRPPARGFTVPMLATFASAASRACSRGVKSGSGMLLAAIPLGLRARTRCRISAITAASSSPFASIMLLPARRNPGEHPAARRDLAGKSGLYRLTRLHHVAQKPVDHVLLKDSQIAICEHIHLERFQLQTQFVRYVAQRQLAMIRQPRLGTN